MVIICPICDFRHAKPGQICAACRSTLGSTPIQQAIDDAVRKRAAAAEAARAALQPTPNGPTSQGPDAETALSLDEALAGLEKAASDVPEHRLGDKIAVVAKAFGFVQTPGCGCQKRQENLNYVNFNQSPVQVAKDIWNALRVKKANP